MYRLIDEIQASPRPPWDPRGIFLITLLSYIFNPLSWVAGMVWFAANWGRLQQPRGRLIAFCLLLGGFLVELNLLYLLLNSDSTTARALIGQSLHFVPVILLVVQSMQQQTVAFRFAAQSKERARLFPVAWGFFVLALTGLLGAGA